MGKFKFIFINGLENAMQFNENRQNPPVIYELHKFNFVLFVSYVDP